MGRGSSKGSGRLAHNNNNNNSQHRNAFAPNHNKGQKHIRKHDDNVCSRCGINRYWVHACRTSKHIVDLYQISIKRKGKRFETHFAKNAYEKANIVVNNALIKDIFILPSLMISPPLLWKQNHLKSWIFLMIPMTKQSPLVGGKEPRLRSG